jgi:DedD protein
MDSRAKQRLTGAVILVALFVLLVPELLTGPRDSATAPATAEEEGLRRYTIDLNAPSASPEQQPVEPAVQLPPVAPSGGDGDSQSERARPGESARPEAAPASAQSEPRQASGAETGASGDPRQSDGAAAPATPARPAPVTAAPATTRESPAVASRPPAAGSGRFVVQLGSFGSRDNAERLVRDMTAKGFATFIAPITTNGRELYRVRVGPTKDRASAEALAAQLKRVGQSGSIVPIS